MRERRKEFNDWDKGNKKQNCKPGTAYPVNRQQKQTVPNFVVIGVCERQLLLPLLNTHTQQQPSIQLKSSGGRN